MVRVYTLFNWANLSSGIRYPRKEMRIMIRSSKVMKMESVLCITLLAIFLTACGGGGGGDDDVVGEPIASERAAENAVKDVAAVIQTEVLGSLPHGTYTNEVVDGISGTASVTGDYYYYDNVDCGFNCVESYNDTTITVVFTDYKAASADNAETTLSGTVTYANNKWSRQSGLSYSSGGSIPVSGNDVSYYRKIWNDYETWGYQDTISFSASGSSIHGSFSGWCTASNGMTYSF